MVGTTIRHPSPVAVSPESQENVDNDDERPSKRVKLIQAVGSESSSSSSSSVVVMGNCSSSACGGSIEEHENESKHSSLDQLQPSSVEIYSFFLKDPVTVEERGAVDPELGNRMSQILSCLERRGAGVAFRQYQAEKRELAQQQQLQRQQQRNGSPDLDEVEQLEREVVVPRSYQLKLLQRAAVSNTIVHLGTGMGKTLIAILLMKQIMGIETDDNATTPVTDSAMSSTTTNQQVVFLVPSVALVLQQTATLKENLSVSIATAYNATVHADESRRQLSRCHVLVATHGAYLDLLLHYGDLFSLSKAKLLILDECHNCIKNSPYATLMRQFYHTLPHEQRPRVLGLTASPLINVKKSCHDDELNAKLHELESTLDARIVPLQELGLERDEIPAFLQKEAQEQIIWYHPTILAHQEPQQASWMDLSTLKGLNPCREKEFRQVIILYQELGPEVTRLFCQGLVLDLACNSYEQETALEYAAAKDYLTRIIMLCSKECQDPRRRFTPKLQALHLLLDQQYATQPQAVGLVFVQRRATACALHLHFQNILHQRRRNKQQTTKQNPKEDNTLAEGLNDDSSSRNVASSNSQFDDADDDPVFLSVIPPPRSTMPVPPPPPQEEDATWMDQFADAEDDPFEPHAIFGAQVAPTSQLPVQQKPLPTRSSRQHRNDDLPVQELIKSSALIRKTSGIFRISRKTSNVHDDEPNELEQESSIRQVLNALKRRDINLLIATSVVEEGIDVQACSFVVVFDRLTSLKAFIQMKGRARHKDASFFVFEPKQDEHGGAIIDAGALPLSTVKDVEARVNQFLASRESFSDGITRKIYPLSSGSSITDDDETDDQKQELQALADGKFTTKHGTVTLGGAKSLLHRYALMQPMDPAVRTNRASLRAHLPVFDSEANKLFIPSHLGTYHDIRVVSLPASFADSCNKKQREALVSLRACVRLFRHGLLNERLLPLGEKDIQERFVAASSSLTSSTSAEVDVLKPVVNESLTQVVDNNQTTALFLHRIIPTGQKLHEYMDQWNPEGRRLAILSWFPVSQIPDYEYSMQQFGSITHSLGEGISVLCNCEEIELASQFFVMIWNARWKRRTKDTQFHCRSPASTYFPYRVVCVNREGRLDWEHMKELLQESLRSKEERTQVVRDLVTTQPLARPRLWSPCYDENAVYLVYGPSGDTCDAPFPHDHGDEKIKTYKDYYEHKKHYVLKGDSILFDAARQWVLPRRAWADPHENADDFKQVKLPQFVCMEAALANSGMSLLTVLLPQFCHHIELHTSSYKFLEHLDENVPNLAHFLRKVPLPKLTMAITAKSCHALVSYEKMEWLGDGVLKLAQTDSLVNSTKLGDWIRHLPEGYLNAARSFLGSNRNLKSACKRLGLDKFIQTESLSRGYWTPEPMELVDSNGVVVPRVGEEMDGKVCADVVESIIGLVFLEFGYKEASAATDALQLTIPHKEDELLATASEEMIHNNSKLITAAENFTGHSPFQRKSLVEEALTHPTKMSTKTSYSSYQRLEWIGDAVLCLAIRSWIYKYLPDMELGDMVSLESSLVCNETLAFLAFQAGLPQHLRHGDQTLPSRIENYAWSVREQGRGLWGTDPPKALADIVEALFGAVHVDGGFHAGQQSVYHALQSVLSAVQNSRGSELERYCCHPKRTILSELGCLVEIEETSEESLALSLPDLKIWCGDEWTLPHPHGTRPVALLKCLSEPMLAVADSVTTSAVNRVCAFVSTFLFAHSPFLERFRSMKADIQRSLPDKTSMKA